MNKYRIQFRKWKTRRRKDRINKKFREEAAKTALPFQGDPMSDELLIKMKDMGWEDDPNDPHHLIYKIHHYLRLPKKQLSQDALKRTITDGVLTLKMKHSKLLKHRLHD